MSVDAPAAPSSGDPSDRIEITRRDAFIAGAKATIPLMLGALPFGLIFGAAGLASGLSPFAIQAMSLFVFAGSAQFISVDLVANAVPMTLIIVTTFVVNLRHLLYSATLAPHLRSVSQWLLVPMGFMLTDETFVVASTRYTQEPDAPHKQWYFLGSAVAMYINWQLWTLVGVLVGQSIPNIENWGLDFALTVTFIGMVVPLMISRPVLVSVVVGGVTAVLANGMPNKSGLMVAAVLGVAAGYIAESLQPQKEKEQAAHE